MVLRLLSTASNGDKYIIDINKFNPPDDSEIEDILNEYTSFSENVLMTKMSQIINEDVFDKARVNLSNLLYKDFIMTKKINILSITLIFLIGCSENISPVDSGLEQQIYHHGNGSEPQGIDPHIVTGVPEHHILISLCEGLTIPNPNPKGSDGYIPGTAESWTISDDGKEYIFKLNKNAKWSNGDPVTADDFVWSWKRILNC